VLHVLEPLWKEIQVNLWMKRAIGVAALAGASWGRGPFALVGDPATDNLPPTGELALADLTG
jgi:hypothetical protein